MGWLLPKAHRDKLVAKCTLPDTRAKGAKSTMFAPPAADTHVFVDAPAVLRSNCIPGRSAMDIATSLANRIHATSGTPEIVEVFFDKADRSTYPPQREAVGVERARTVTAPSYDSVAALVERYGCRPQDFGTVSTYHMPYLRDRGVDWKLLFSSSHTKALAWNLLATALHHTFAERNTMYVRIYRPDGATVNVAGAWMGGGGAPPQALSVYGEADLQVFAAARLASSAGQAITMMTIDTDFILMAVCSSGFNPTAPATLDLKTSAIDVKKLCAALGGGDEEVRLNTAFWMLAAGADYSPPLTRAGYYSKDIVALITTPAPESTRPIRRVAKGWKFDPRVAMKALSTKRKRKTIAVKTKHSENVVFCDMLFCLQYYGFMFDGAFPKHPSLWWDRKTGPALFGTPPVTEAEKKEDPAE